MIETEKISGIDRKLLAASVIDGIMEHFKSEENQRRFRAWQKERKAGGTQK